MNLTQKKFKIMKIHQSWIVEHPHGGTYVTYNFNGALIWCLAMIRSMQREKQK